MTNTPKIALTAQCVCSQEIESFDNGRSWHHTYNSGPHTPRPPTGSRVVGMNPEQLRVESILTSILKLVREHRTHRYEEPASLGFRIYLSVEDAQLLDEETKRVGNYFPISKMKHGDEGTLLGLKFMVDEAVSPGTIFVGYRILVEKR